jgi:hypothetical protein
MLEPTRIRFFVAVGAAATFAGAAAGAIVPFTEGFNADAAEWRTSAGGALAVWSASGGPDGSAHVSNVSFSFIASAAGDTPILFRGQDNFGSSGGAFVGDYITQNVTSLSCFVRHDAPEALNFFVRFAKPANFPAAIALDFAPVPPNVWTQITIAIDPGNPQFVSFEGSDFAAIFAGIGKVQIGVSVPGALAGQPVAPRFDLDRVSIVPAPAAGALAGAGLLALRRRRVE